MCIRDRIANIAGYIREARDEKKRKREAEDKLLDTVEENLEVLRQQGKNVSRAMLKGLEKRKHNLDYLCQQKTYVNSLYYIIIIRKHGK